MTIVTMTLNPAVDLATSVTSIQPERKLHCTGAEATPGGGGVNVARAVCGLGGVATAVFPCGGSTGALLCELLSAEGVPIRPVPAAGPTRQDLAVTELSTGRQYRFVLPGPTLSATELERCVEALLDHLAPRSLVVLSGSLPGGVAPEQFAALASAARNAGHLVVVDTSGPALRTAALVGVHLLKPSVNELRGYAQRELVSHVEIALAAHELLEEGDNGAVLVSIGPEGALLVLRDGAPIHISPPAVRPVSGLGAGDSLVGGLTLAIERGDDLVEAARRGVAAGTAATISPGHGLCHSDDVDRILRDVRIRALRAVSPVG